VFGVQNQSRLVSDGIDHTEGNGGTGFYEDYYANEEVSVSALGSDVEMNSPGAALVTTIKSGGNVFKGLEHVSYEPGSFVGSNAPPADLASRGYTCPKNGNGVAQCENPNLLFWEGHADLGGPIVKDKMWFYGAYNHFKINKQVAGVDQSVATDLGIFDNYTTKETAKIGQNDTLIGYFQGGRKQKPKRGLSTLLPPESIRAQDSWSMMFKGEWQKVINSRTFLDVNVGRFSLDWPMVVAVDPAVKPPTQYRATGAVSGAGWNAFSELRSKPQGHAQLTYFLPDKGGSHDLKFGYELLRDSIHYGINGTSGPIRYSVNSAGVIDRVRFADVGATSDFEKGWDTSRLVDLHHAFYAQDRWSPTNRLTITAGVRADYQKSFYEASTRKPLIGPPVFPAETVVPQATLWSKTNYAPRVGFSYDLSGKGATVLKAFYGRYYNNMADTFSPANPGGTNYADYNFNDLNGNGKYDGPQELGTLRTRIGGASSTVDPNLKTPYTDEISGTVEHQFWGESSLRVTFVRKMQRNYVPAYFTPYVPEWVGNFSVHKTVTGGNNETFNVVDIPDALAAFTDTLFTNIPNSDFNYNTLEVAFNKRFGSKFFVHTSFDNIWRDELRSPDISDVGSTSPLDTDPIGVFWAYDVNPAAPNRQKTTMWHYQLMGRYVFPADIGFAASFRYQAGFPYSRVIPDQETDPALNATPSPFFAQNLDQNRADNVALLNFRVDKSFKLGNRGKVTAMLDIYNILNTAPVTNFSLLPSNFKQVIAVLDPRVFQMGFRFEF